MKITENVCFKQQVSDEQNAPIRIVLPFKDQKSANVVRHQLGVSRKSEGKGQFIPKEHKPPIVNQKSCFIISSVVCVMPTMSASRVDTYIRRASDQQ